MNRRKSIGDRTEPCGTPLLIEKDSETIQSTNSAIERLLRQLDIRSQNGEVKP